ncbi:hypothetical protein AJ78_02748 [Emergomyces pasteurianus Ep9510]|uniref:BZIP domain-containing protein n=1 Tax=Emergomyces pasteurianus Ep9510 TaxID=1447872 RepID=A0A1J9PMQ3_9EURO|nr:hypothetical protein AJ78_02748 [Emergomyces pasteurianus Ep9510]
MPNSLPPFTSASFHSAAPAAAISFSTSSSSPASICSSASLQQQSSFSYHQYDPQHDTTTRLNGDDYPQLNHHLPSDSLGLPLCSEAVASQVQTATTATTSPWLNFLELNHDLSENDQSLRSSQLPGPSLQTESASTFSNPLSDAPVPASISEYDLLYLYPYSKGDELKVDNPFCLMDARDSSETSTQPVTQYHHQSNGVQLYPIPTSQTTNNQDVNHPQRHKLGIPPQSQPVVSSPLLITTVSPTNSCTNNHHSSPSSTQTPHSPAAVTTTALSTDRVADKRRRNTLAARRFRQKQHDRVAELERALESACKERDELRMQAARWEGEVVALRGMLQKKS